MKSKLSTKRIAMAGLLAALTFAGSAMRITIPVSIAGTSAFHLGNIMCALSGILLGPWLGGAAAGIGTFLYDMTNPAYIDEAWMTFLMKGAYAVASGLVIRVGSKKDFGYFKAALATIAGALAYAVLYLGKTYFYRGLFKQGLTAHAAWIGMLSKVPATVFNAVIAIIIAPILAVAIRKALEKNHLRLE